jgi:hypothetical protein
MNNKESRHKKILDNIKTPKDADFVLFMLKLEMNALYIMPDFNLIRKVKAKKQEIENRNFAN